MKKLLYIILCSAAPSIAATQITYIDTVLDPSARYSDADKQHAQQFIKQASFHFWWNKPKVEISLMDLEYTMERFRTLRTWDNNALPVIDLIYVYIRSLDMRKKRTQYLMAELMYRIRPRLAEDIEAYGYDKPGDNISPYTFCLLAKGLNNPQSLTVPHDVVHKHKDIIHSILSFYHATLPFTSSTKDVFDAFPDTFPLSNLAPKGVRVATEAMIGIFLAEEQCSPQPPYTIPDHILLRTNDAVTLQTLLGNPDVPIPQIKLYANNPARCAQNLIQQSLAKRSYQLLFSLSLTPEIFHSVLDSFRKARPWDAEATPVIHEICRYIRTLDQAPHEHEHDIQQLMASLLYATRPRIKDTVKPGSFNSVRCPFSINRNPGHIAVSLKDKAIVCPALLATLWVLTQGQVHQPSMLDKYYNDPTFGAFILSIIAGCLPQSLKLMGEQVDLDMFFNQKRSVTLRSLQELL